MNHDRNDTIDFVAVAERFSTVARCLECRWSDNDSATAAGSAAEHCIATGHRVSLIVHEMLARVEATEAPVGAVA